MQPDTDTLDWLIRQRRSVRAYLDKPVDPALLRQLLTLAGRAPSGGNMQPWQVQVVQGETKARLSAALTAAYFDRDHRPVDQYRFYPSPPLSPYDQRIAEFVSDTAFR